MASVLKISPVKRFETVELLMLNKIGQLSDNDTFIVTGVAGFIGAEVALALLKKGCKVFGLDNLNSYYDVQLKHDRLVRINKFHNFTFIKVDISNESALVNVFENMALDKSITLIHLAAQAGVRYSIEHPQKYIQSNLVGFANILECCRHYKVKHLTYASSSSVYGANTKTPFSETDDVDNPVSLYAATKKSNELLAHSYAHLYEIPTTGLRFFTVYGPWGRPDMAYYIFTKAILENQPIKIFNQGDMQRDFTYIDDIVNGVLNVAINPPKPQALEKSSSPAPYKVYNIGNNQPEKLMDMIEIIEDLLGKKAIKNFQSMFTGDVKETFADINALANDFGFKPTTSLRQGLEKFTKWYQSYYQQT